VDETVVFRPLGREDVGRIVEIQLVRLRRLLAERQITIELSEAAREAIADAGYDPLYGARPLKRALQRLVQDPLATMLLKGEFRNGDHVVVDEGPSGAVQFKKGSRPAEAPTVVH
jgi:ATP-dependent Clp protease ATP-binding subunit ClpB